MMRVLHVINGLGTGGAERSLGEMLPKLDEHGVESVVACLHRRPEGIQDSVIDAGHDVRFLESASLLAGMRQVRALIREVNPDVVHTTLFESDIVGRCAAVGTGVPVVSSIVNTSYTEAREADPNVRPWKLRAARMADGWTSRHLTSRFQALTGAVRDSTVAALRVDPSVVRVIGRGRDLARLGAPSPERTARVREALGIGSSQPVIVTSGRREFQKGQRYLIEAFAKISATQPEAVLLIAGRDGAASAHLSADVERLGLDTSVRFLGHRNDIPDLLAAADVFAFPSLYEGFGGAVIEAMSMATPIVASDLPAIREVVQGEAVLVPPADPQLLAEALLGVLADPGGSAERAQQARAVFLREYTLDAVVDELIALYAETIAHGR